MARIIEQADRASNTATGATYSWILDQAKKSVDLAPNLIGAGWKWVPGRKIPFLGVFGDSVFVTNDPDLAARTATRFNLDIISDGSHKVLGVPALLCR